MIKELQRNAAFRDPTMAAAHLVGAQAAAMQGAANNAGGAAMGFMGMNMAGQAGGVNAANLYAMGSQQAPAAPQADGWTCPGCGKTAFGKFCTECGTKKPEDGWTCPSCGKKNKGKFCAECGTKKPADAPLYKCDKCGWEPEDPAHPPKFCPECGDIFDDSDIVK
jgi:membrane protease subunit (stomatin/prohibitin family)